MELICICIQEQKLQSEINVVIIITIFTWFWNVTLLSKITIAHVNCISEALIHLENEQARAEVDSAKHNMQDSTPSSA